jgi:TRAP-type C4-dicarboxylate transport system permease small subunit
MLLVAVLLGDVAKREVTGSGLTWARDVGVLANLVLTMVGIGLASAEGDHLRPRLADRLLPARWESTVTVVQESVMSAFCLGFAIVALRAVVETYGLGEQLPVLAWPVWPLQLIIPAVFLVAAIRHGLLAAFPSLRPGAPSMPAP